jgi:phospholipid/cholesterol/gamma-HCH transport system permease protein
MYLEAERSGADMLLRLRGDWNNAHLAKIQLELGARGAMPGGTLRIDTQAARFDLAGAWLLHDLLCRCAAAGDRAEFTGPRPELLLLIERTEAEGSRHALPEPAPGDWLDPGAAVESLGRRVMLAQQRTVSALDFLGQVCLAAARAVISLRHLRATSIARHVYDTGVAAIPIVSLIAFLISVILAYIGAQQLLRFGADIFVVDLVTIGLLRELGVLLTAIIVAGRSGSSFAAEIGAMRLNEEVDALHATGVDPVEVLVLPRIIGLVIALPLLTVIADVIGLVGGGLLCRVLLDMPLIQYLNRAEQAIGATTFWVGVCKAPVFAVLIGIAGARCGFRVRGSTRELGRLTTLAVVQSIFFVILADAIFAVVFLELKI